MKQKFNKRTSMLSFLHDMYLISARGRIIKKDLETKSINGENDFDMNGLKEGNEGEKTI